MEGQKKRRGNKGREKKTHNTTIITILKTQTRAGTYRLDFFRLIWRGGRWRERERERALRERGRERSGREKERRKRESARKEREREETQRESMGGSIVLLWFSLSSSSFSVFPRLCPPCPKKKKKGAGGEERFLNKKRKEKIKTTSQFFSLTFSFRLSFLFFSCVFRFSFFCNAAC